MEEENGNYYTIGLFWSYIGVILGKWKMKWKLLYCRVVLELNWAYYTGSIEN